MSWRNWLKFLTWPVVSNTATEEQTSRMVKNVFLRILSGVTELKPLILIFDILFILSIHLIFFLKQQFLCIPKAKHSVIIHKASTLFRKKSIMRLLLRKPPWLPVVAKGDWLQCSLYGKAWTGSQTSGPFQTKHFFEKPKIKSEPLLNIVGTF